MFASGKLRGILKSKVQRNFGKNSLIEIIKINTQEMKIKQLLIVAIAVLVCNLNGFSQDMDFKASGQPTFKIFTNYHSTFFDGTTYNQFEITRAYLGYKHTFSPDWTGAVIFDVGDPEAGKHQMAAFVKNAYMKYKKDAWTIDFGLITTTAFKVQEDFWGYRYMLKSFMDEYSFGSSADIGASVKYKFNKAISADLIVMNGEGYKKIENDSTFSVGLGLTVKPVENLTLRGYAETTTQETSTTDKRNVYALFLGYEIKDLSIAAEYNREEGYKWTEGKDLTGYSFYATYKTKKAKLFARYDDLSSDDNWNGSNDLKMVMLGAEFSPVKGIKITPNYRHSDYEGVDAGVDQIFVNCEIKF